MSTPARIAFASCGPQAEIARQMVGRFSTIAVLKLFECAVDGRDVEAVVPALREASPHVVITPPASAAYVADHLDAQVIPFEFGPAALLGRVETALGRADSVAVLTATGSVSSASGRLLKRTGGAVHLFSWDTHSHLRDLLGRAKRMGVRAVIGGDYTLALGQQEGLAGFSLNDGPDEADGSIALMILKAISQAAPRIVGHQRDLALLGLMLERITDGSVGRHDMALGVDPRGTVTRTFAHRCEGGTSSDSLPAVPPGVGLAEALQGALGRFTGHVGGDVVPLQLDVYPVSASGEDGYLVVLRGEPRPTAGAPGGGGESDRIGPLLERVEALVERTDALTRARRARRAPRRFLASLRRRTFLVDWDRVRYFELRSGLVYAALASGETYVTNYTLADVAARVDARDFFRIHRNVIVNLNYVTEIERWGVGQLRVVIEGADSPAFVASRPASAALRKLLKY